MSNLETLKGLTEKLPALTEFVNHIKGFEVNYDVLGGECFGIGLLQKSTVAVQEAYMSKGSVFPAHSHCVVEYLIVHQGELSAEICGEVNIIKTGNFIKIQPEVLHKVTATEETYMIAITIPAGKGYPNAGKA